MMDNYNQSKLSDDLILDKKSPQKKVFSDRLVNSFLRKILIILLLFLGVNDFIFAQGTYSQNFATNGHGWSTTQFSRTTTSVCATTGSLRRNLYSSATTGITASPSMFASSGGLVTMSYQYKIINFSGSTATPNTFGSFKVQYSVDNTNWIDVAGSTISTDHIASTACATKTVTFTPAIATNLYVRFNATWAAGDYYLYFDEVSVNQATPPACSGTPTAGTVTPTTQSLCSGTTPAALTVAGFTSGVSGVTFQWQQSTDNVNWGAVVGGSGATTATYTPPAFGGTTIYYRCRVTCTNSALFADTASVTVSPPANPTTQATALAASGITYNGATLGWTNGNGARRVVFLSNSPIVDPVNGNAAAYTANTVYAGTGQQVVFDGTAATVNVTGLSIGTTYYVKVFEYLRCGTGPYDYYFNSSTGTNSTSFTTKSPLSTFPFLETFDASSTSLSSWISSAGSGATVQWGVTTSDATHGAGAPKASTRFAFLDVYNALTTYNTYNLTTPMFSLDSAPKQLSYYYWLGTSGYTTTPVPLTVQISTNGGTTWVNLFAHTSANSVMSSASTSPWTLKSIDLSAYVNQTVMFKFVSQSNYGSGFTNQGIDEFSIDALPTCFIPTALTASSITPTTATVSWTAPATGTTPVQYEYAVTTSSTAPASGITNASTSASVTGLSANTTYYIHVRSVCTVGSDFSVWTSGGSFTTPAVASVPWTEGFATTTAPTGWSSSGGSYGSTRGATGNPGNNWYFNLWSLATSANISTINVGTITPGLNFSFNYQLTNYDSPYGTPATNAATILVEVSTNFGSTYSTLESFNSEGTSGWKTKSYSLASYVGQYVKFRITGTWNSTVAGDFDLALDNFSVNYTPITVSSFTPTAVCSADLATSTVTLTGTNFTNATDVKLNGVSQTFSVVNDTTITVTLSGTSTAGTFVVYNAFTSGTNATALTINTSPSVSAITAAASEFCMPNTLALSNATAGGVWSSSNNAIATVDAAGLVTGVAEGTATISYTVTDLGCSTAVTYAVTVNAPVTITTNPSNQPVVTGNDTSFTVAATGTSLTYQWEESTDGGLSYAPIAEGGVYSGATTATLTLTAVPSTMNGNFYQCVVSGAATCDPQTSLAALLTVGNTGIATQPSNYALCDSGSATFSVVPSGDVVSYQWYQDAGLGPEALVDDASVSGANTDTLTISGLDTNFNGFTYYVEVVGPTNTATSNSATLSVSTSASIVTDPTAQTVCYSGGSVSFTAAAAGSFTGVQWQYSTDNTNWSNVANATPTGVTYNGATTTTLGVTTTAATPIAGTYYYRMMADATAPCSDVYSASAQLLFNNPTITSAPAATSVLAGNTATFTVVSDATGTVTYQWQRATTLNGTYANVVNATPANVTYNGATTATLSVITTGAATVGGGNFYRVIVTSDGCSVTSTGALLTITNYCTANATSTADDDIAQVIFGSLTNPSSMPSPLTNNAAASNTYTNFTALTPPSFTQGGTYPITVKQFNNGIYYTCWTKIFFDWNQDGDFADAGEAYNTTGGVDGPSTAPANGIVYSGNIAIPINALTGNTRMRVLLDEDGTSTTNANGCGTFTWGEVEDYTITVLAAPSCAGTPATPTASASASTICAGSSVNLSLAGIPAELGYTYQWYSRALPSGSFAAISGATTAAYTATVTESSEIYAIVTCSNSGLTATSNTLTVNTNLCNYTVTRNTGIIYNSIMTTGSTYTTLSGSDDGKTNTVSLTGTTFKYNGAAVTGFYASTNGWMTFNTGQTSTAYINDLTSTGQNNVLAPFWEDLVIKGNLTASKDVSMRYQIIGTLGSGTADIVIEWAEMEKFLYPDPNINFQVVLHESDNSIDFNYGQMQLFNGASNNTSYGYYTYSVGMNGTTPSTADTTNRVMLQNYNNSNFSATAQNSLSGSPDCNTQLRFVPSAAFVSGAAPASTVPVNDEAASAITLNVNLDPCTSVCGNVYTSKNATASAGITACTATTPGNPNDDVFFKFTTNSTITNYKIEVQASTGYDPIVQILDSSLNPIGCYNATADGISEVITSVTLALSTEYYLRIYDRANGQAGGASGSGEFAVCISQILPPPAYDEPAGAVSLTVGTSCAPVASVPAEILRSTATAGIQVCNATTAGTPDDDVWYKFTTPAIATGITYTINVQGNSTFNPVVQLFAGTPGAANSVTCVNATGNGGLETITSSTLTAATDYYVRVYNSGAGAANGSFTICAFASTPVCITAPTAPSDASTACESASGTTLSWAATSSATHYDVYFESALVSADQTALSWTTPVLAAGTYTWSVVPKNAYGAASSCTNFTFTVAANVTYYADLDNDGFGNNGFSVVSCTGAPGGYVTDNTDCNDNVTYYQDNDGDGYGSTVKLACGTITNNSDCNDNLLTYVDADADGYGTSTPAACGASNTTDCNDAVSGINPGAVDVCYDGIDNDCNGNVDNVGLPGGCIPIVSTIPSATCNSIVAYNQIVYTSLVSGAQSYRYRVTEVNPVDDSEISGTQVIATMILRNLYLRNLSNYKYNAKYKVEVAVLYNNVWQAYDPNFCYVWTESPVSTIVGCGTPPTQVSSINTAVSSTIVSRCPGYKYQVTRLDNSYNAVGTSQEIATGIRNFRFSQVTDMIYDAYYEVKCSVRNTDGTYLPYGPSCIVQAPKYPVSELVPAQCEDYAVLNYNEYINAVFVSGAEFYRFRLTSEVNNYDVSVDRPLRQFRLSDFPGLVPGETYTVEVAVQMPGQPNVGPYSKACTIIVPFTTRDIAPSSPGSVAFDVEVYPNPFAEQFYFKVASASSADYTLQVYDMMGRRIETRTVGSDSIESTEVGVNCPAGVYNVIITQGENTKTLRVVKR